MQQTEKQPLVYEKVQASLRQLVEQRNYIAGDRIPSERDLCERFDVHRATLRKAIDNLIAEGLLERRGTSGTYIPSPTVLRPISAHSFSQPITEIVGASGGKAGSKLMFFEQGQASVRIADRLDVEVGDPLFIIKRLRTVNEQPFCIETTWIPTALVPGLTATDLVRDLSLYGLLRDRYDIAIGTAKATISSGTISTQDLETLDMKQGEVALIIDSVTSDKDGNPIEYLSSLNHPRRVMLVVE
ncbi:GntR family transcriptional regulator [Jannaschia marina]|uniref:GntR family transcriptional regulator n=1 Tax=Jannaschia marina TaxID=2741674 RepID=UPI0015C6B9CB|nr:GntR family transcriptional regulator [Jannaschia marina]